MLELIPNVPDNVVAMTAKGEVTKEDFEEVVFPVLAEKVKDHDKIRILFQLGPEYTGMTGGALWQDDKAARKYYHRYEKIAVVGDQNWLHRSLKAFGWMMPGEKKAIGAAELDDALAWIAD